VNFSEEGKGYELKSVLSQILSEESPEAKAEKAKENLIN
jgi:hypothetical protein